MSTLGDELPRQMARVRDEVMPAYQDPALNGTGTFALMLMRKALDDAAKALAEGDVVAMIRVHEELKGFNT